MTDEPLTGNPTMASWLVNAKLAVRALLGLLSFILVLALSIFVAAGTTRYPEAWVFLSVFAACAAAITIDLLVRDPLLVERRTHAGPFAERRVRQKLIQSFATVAFLVEVVVSALDHRFGWSRPSFAIVALGDLMTAIGFLLVYLVFRANPFASSLIETFPEQELIDTGPYAVVRHPMYSGALVLLAGIPLSLGSYWGLLALAPMTASLVWRLHDEEEFLLENLSGYGEYRKRTRYRLIPLVW